jgi:hypothetical protein
MQSMVSSIPAIEAAFCSAMRVTLVGSTAPAFAKSSNLFPATLDVTGLAAAGDDGRVLFAHHDVLNEDAITDGSGLAST